jgi:hypothetical protein
MINMRRPCAVEWYEPSSVDCAREDVFRHKVPLVPEQELGRRRALMLSGLVLAVANTLEPVPVGVARVLEPFVDQHIRSVVIERLAHELAHGDARPPKLGVVSFRHPRLIETGHRRVEIRARRSCRSQTTRVVEGARGKPGRQSADHQTSLLGTLFSGSHRLPRLVSPSSVSYIVLESCRLTMAHWLFAAETLC